MTIRMMMGWDGKMRTNKKFDDHEDVDYILNGIYLHHSMYKMPLFL